MPDKKSVTCPETGIEVGGDTGNGIYHHLVTVMHVPPGPVSSMRQYAHSIGGVYEERVSFLLDALAAEGE